MLPSSLRVPDFQLKTGSFIVRNTRVANAIANATENENGFHVNNDLFRYH